MSIDDEKYGVVSNSPVSCASSAGMSTFLRLLLTFSCFAGASSTSSTFRDCFDFFAFVTFTSSHSTPAALSSVSTGISSSARSSTPLPFEIFFPFSFFATFFTGDLTISFSFTLSFPSTTFDFPPTFLTDFFLTSFGAFSSSSE